jgi:hypothetical protein
MIWMDCLGLVAGSDNQTEISLQLRGSSMFSSEQEALRALKGQDRLSAANAEAFLWRHWCQSGDLEADRVFRDGVDAMQRGELELAETLFGSVLEMAPQFAEGWNKRATVRYLRQNFAASDR